MYIQIYRAALSFINIYILFNNFDFKESNFSRSAIFNPRARYIFWVLRTKMETVVLTDLRCVCSWPYPYRCTLFPLHELESLSSI